MSVGYRGIGGHEGMGLWGPLLFSIPLLAAWYSFERLASIRRTYEQTIVALSVVPELAGLVRAGHAERVADLSVALGRELQSRPHRPRVPAGRRAAAPPRSPLPRRPEVRGRAIEPSEVTDKGAEILRQTEYLRPAGDLLASDTASRRQSDPAGRECVRRAHRRRPRVRRRGDRSALLRSRLRLRPASARRARAGVGADAPDRASRSASTPLVRSRGRTSTILGLVDVLGVRAGGGAAAGAVREVDEADRDDEVAERDRRVDGADPSDDVVAEHRAGCRRASRVGASPSSRPSRRRRPGTACPG